MSSAKPSCAAVRHGTRGLLLDLEAILSRPSTRTSTRPSLLPTTRPTIRPTLRPSGQRRQALHYLAAAGAALAVSACGGGNDEGSADSGSAATGSDDGTTTGDSPASGSSGSTGDSSAPTAGSCSEIPSETEGPYPADGTQMGGRSSGSAVNALAISGIVRSDIRTSLSGAGATAQGVPMTLKLKLVDSNNGCAVLANRAIYVWHCDRDGNYSLYSNGVSDLDYLRGVQVTDANGEVTFTTIFPACYAGRWPHIHFEIYSTLTDALDGSRVGDYTKVSQLALPADVCTTIYNTASGYATSVRNLSGVTLASDNVFSNDQAARQLATVTGSVSTGYVVSLTVGVAG